MPASDTRVAHWLLEGITETVTTYANESSAKMIGIIGPAAAVLLTIYVLLWGAAVASGHINEPFTDGARRITRMCAIVAFALTAGIYGPYIVDFFMTVPASMAAELVSASGPGPAPSDTNAIAQILDNALSRGIDIGNRIWEEGNKRMADSMIGINMAGLGFYFLALIVYLAAAVVVAIGAGMVFVAYIALAILLAVGPLFILLAIFPVTQRFFEAWIGQVVNYAILFLIVACTVGLCMAFMDSLLKTINDTYTWEESIIVTIKVFGACLATVAVLLQSRSIASGLGGGVALQAQNTAGRLAGGVGRTASGVAGAALAIKTGGASVALGAARTIASSARAGKASYNLARRTWQGRNRVTGS